MTGKEITFTNLETNEVGFEINIAGNISQNSHNQAETISPFRKILQYDFIMKIIFDIPTAKSLKNYIYSIHN